MKRIACGVLVLPFLMASIALSQDRAKAMSEWPHWRGPLATGEAPLGNPPITWSEKTNVKWKVPLPGRGSSTPIVWGDQVFVAVAFDTGRPAKPADIPKPHPTLEAKTQPPTTYHQFALMCFDRQTGKVRWQQTACERVPHEGHHPSHSYAAGSPTTDGKHVWVSFGSRGVYCYDLAGKLVWERDLGFLYSRLAWGEASTPVLHGNLLVLNWDREIDSKLMFLDALTGKTVKQIDREEPSTWNTPAVVEHKGTTQVIVNGTNKARGYDLATGEILWQCGGQTPNAIPSALVADGVAYIMSGYKGALAVAVPLDARGDLSGGDKLLWKHTKGTPYVPTPLLVGDKLYFTQANESLLTCLDAKTGKPHFERQRLEGVTNYYASPVAAAGRIYLVDRDGTTLVLKQSTKIEVLATNVLDDNIDACPAVVGRQLFLRGHKHLYCIEAP